MPNLRQRHVPVALDDQTKPEYDRCGRAKSAFLRALFASAVKLPGLRWTKAL